VLDASESLIDDSVEFEKFIYRMQVLEALVNILLKDYQKKALSIALVSGKMKEQEKEEA
jgi:hypothetical protein